MGTAATPDVGPFWDALSKAGADVVVNGHDHDYERFAPQDPAGDKDATNGIREFVVGTGGASLTGFRPFFLTAANSELRLSARGVIRFTLREGSYEWAVHRDERQGLRHGPRVLPLTRLIPLVRQATVSISTWAAAYPDPAQQ